MFIDMLPNNLGAWVSLLGACFIGFMIGKWIRDRRNKTMAGSKSITRTGSTRPAKRVSKGSGLRLVDFQNNYTFMEEASEAVAFS